MEEIFKCEQCGRLVPKSNFIKINYNNKSMGVCGKHYGQYQRYRKFLDCSQETQYYPNEFEITDDGVWIYCKNTEKQYTGKFLIDLEDFDDVIKKKWRCWHNSFYTGNDKPIPIHIYLMNPPKGYVVDHINGDRTDNRRQNLRIATYSQNGINKILQSNNTSGITGVSWDKERKKWAPNIAIRHNFFHLGRYDLFEDAVYARYVAEILLFGEYRSFRNDKNIMNEINKCKNKNIISTYVKNKLALKGALYE